jgi:hypothetical protein
MSVNPANSSTENGERVHTVWDYWDGPREGIADFQGKPHIYKCQFSETEDEYTDLFWLMAIDEEVLGLAKEQHAIFLRWRAEFDRGNASAESHPALPADRVRHSESRTILADKLQLQLQLQLQPQHSITRRARFSPSNALLEEDAIVFWAMP